MKPLTHDEERRVAANVAKLPWVLSRGLTRTRSFKGDSEASAPPAA